MIELPGIQEGVALLALGGAIGGFSGTLLLQLVRRSVSKNGHTIEALARLIADLSERLDATEIVVENHAGTIKVQPRSPVRDPQITGRPCFCPEDRWARWRDGVLAGEDLVVGTIDDVKV